MDTTKLLDILSGKNVFDKYLELKESQWFSESELKDIQLYIGIINQQMNNGALYGPYLYEILDYGKQHYKSYSYHFYKR